MSSNRDDEDEGDPIDSMLSNTPNNLQDLIDRATTDDGLIKSPSQFSTDQGYHNNLKVSSFSPLMFFLLLMTHLPRSFYTFIQTATLKCDNLWNQIMRIF